MSFRQSFLLLILLCAAQSCGLIEDDSEDENQADTVDEDQINASFTKTTFPLIVEAYIDGKSLLKIKGSTVWWHHLDFVAPGLWGGREPTVLNDQDWYPEWPQVVTHCDCDSSSLDAMEEPLPSRPVLASLNNTGGRGSVKINEQPNITNDFTLSVEFNDNSFPGPDWYRAEIDIYGDSIGGGEGTGGNTIPVADPGVHQKVATGFLVNLDGSGSSDANGDALTYRWSIYSAPTGSNAVLSNANAVNPTYTADTDGLYVINLIVSDGIDSSDVDTVVVIATSGNQPMILVDASKGGGTWWFPQGSDGIFSSDDHHQGKALADYLKSLGYTVIELPRFTGLTGGTSITTSTELLNLFKLVIRSSGFFGYSPVEIDAYHDYVSDGGSLLLLTDHGRFLDIEPLALSFGLSFEGISVGANIIDTFETHSITAGVSSLRYGVGSGITAFPPTANILGYLSANTFLDLNDNGVQDMGEPAGAPVLGEMSIGAGRIIFSGDVNLWQAVPQPLIDNSISWLVGPLPPASGLPLITIDVTPANPEVAAGSSLQFAATGHYSNGSSRDITSEVVWSTSIPGMVTISNDFGSEGLTSITEVAAAAITALDYATGIVGGTTIWDTAGYYLDLTSVNFNSSGTSIEVAPGDPVTLTADYTIWSRSGCPGCIDWIAVGIESDGQDAFHTGIPGVFPGANGSASFTLTVPNTTGTYGVFGFLAPDFTELDALSRYELNFPDGRLIRIGTINVN